MRAASFADTSTRDALDEARASLSIQRESLARHRSARVSAESSSDRLAGLNAELLRRIAEAEAEAAREPAVVVHEHPPVFGLKKGGKKGKRGKKGGAAGGRRRRSADLSDDSDSTGDIVAREGVWYPY